jgi:peptidyl-tRNA hydrolase, PTH2 family
MPYKQIIVIRSDLALSSGKLSAQVAHASYSSAKNTDKKILKSWENEGQKKVVLKAKDVKELMTLRDKCKRLKIACTLIADAGLTEIPAGEITCLGIGPDDEKKIDAITGALPLA